MPNCDTKIKEVEYESFHIDVVSGDKKNVMCKYCKRRPCVWTAFTTDNAAFLSVQHRMVNSGGRARKARKSVFQRITRKLHGVMGAGKRKRLPQCVEDNVRQMFPSKDGRYMGYKEK